MSKYVADLKDAKASSIDDLREGTYMVKQRKRLVPRLQWFPVGASKTEKSHAKKCDINEIMKKYEKTGVIEHVRKVQGQYGDFSEVTDYQSSLNQVMVAQESFMSLPAKVRARFENDPGQFLQFMSDPKNADEMIALGLAKKRITDSPAPKETGDGPKAGSGPNS